MQGEARQARRQGEAEGGGEDEGGEHYKIFLFSNKRSFFGLFWEVSRAILLSVYFLQAAALCLAISRNFVDKELR